MDNESIYKNTHHCQVRTCFMCHKIEQTIKYFYQICTARMKIICTVSDGSIALKGIYRSKGLLQGYANITEP